MKKSPKSKKSHPCSLNSFGTKPNSEDQGIHSIPLLPNMLNSFVFANPNEITIQSSKENLLTNPKSSSYMATNKSKSHKSQKSSKDNKSSFLSSLNQNKSKSSSFSRKLPQGKSLASHDNNKLQKVINKSYEGIAKNSQESFIPSIYFSLNHFPMADSPISAHRSIKSLRTNNNRNTNDTKTIKRNLLIYSVTKEKADSQWPRESLLVDVNEPYRGKVFSNKQNQILKDPVFFEEGVIGEKKQRKKRVNWSIFVEFIGRKIMMAVKRVNFREKIRGFKRNFNEERELAWDIVNLVFLGFYGVWMPIDFAFPKENLNIPIISVSGVFFLCAFLIKLEKVKKKKENQYNFITEGVNLGFLALFLFYSNIFKPLWAILFILAKFSEIVQILTRIRAKITINPILSLFFNVFLIVFRIFCFSNFTACFWIFLGMNPPSQTPYTWLSNEKTTEISLYFRSLSANLANITLVGLGMTQNAIIPLNTIEYAYNCLVTIVGFLFLCYNFKGFSKQIHLNSDREKSKNLMEFERILKNYGLEYEERTIFTHELGLVLDKNKEQRLFAELLKLMPPSLQEKLLLRIYWPIINKIPVLWKNFSKRFLIKLLPKMKILSISPNETLFKEGEYGNSCIFYIIHGEIECFLKMREDDERSHIKLHSLKANEYFREFSFFSGQREKFSAKCQTFCTLLSIDLHDFIETLKEFPLDYENYLSIKERINTYGNMTSLYIKCESCNSRKHQIFECPFLTYNPKKAQIYRSFIKSCNHIERRIFQRKQRKVTINALKSIKTLEVRLLDFQDKYRDEIDLLLDIIYPPSENENSDTAQINETSGTNEHKSNESKESQYTNNRDPVNYLKGAEEFLGNPPSIFLQTPSKKSRKSMTESIFHESDEEGNSEDPSKGHSKTAGEKTINDIEIENDNDQEDDDEEEEEFEEESEKKITSTYKNHSVTTTEKRHSDKERQSDKESARVVTMTQNLSRGQRKLFMELGERMVSERDTFHVLQNFEKMYRVNNNVINTLTANQTFTTGSGKKNVNSYIGSYSKSNSSSYPKKLMVKSSSSSFNSAINRRTPFHDYVSQPLFAFDFDKPKEFKGFLPHNNLEQVLRKAHIDGLLKKVRNNNNNNTSGRMRISKTNKQSHGGTSNMANTSLSTTNKKKEYEEEN